MKQDSDDVLRELRRITRLLVLLAVENRSQKEQISALDTVGFSPKEIADLLGTTSNSVRVTLVAIRKGKKTPSSKR